MSTYDEIEFRKRINKINTLRSLVKDKKRLLAKLRNVPEAADECFKLQTDIEKLESQIAKLQ